MEVSHPRFLVIAQSAYSHHGDREFDYTYQTPPPKSPTHIISALYLPVAKMPEDMISSSAAPEKATNAPEPAEDKLCNDTGPVPAPDATKPEPEPEPEPALPPLTPQEFRISNRLAEKMEYFVTKPPPIFLFSFFPPPRPRTPTH
jgi:hypothetical protein